MKFSFLFFVTALVSMSAYAGDYKNFIRSSVQVDCKSTFEHIERSIVSTNKVTVMGPKNERTRSIEVSSQVQIGNTETKRIYVINKVQYDVSEISANNLPTILTGIHPKTGEKITIKIQRSERYGEFEQSDLIIGKEEQTYLNLQCRVMFAG